MIVSGANQEHGIVSRRDGAADPSLVERFPIGARLRLLPNHACATGAQYPSYVAVTPVGDASPGRASRAGEEPDRRAEVAAERAAA